MRTYFPLSRFDTSRSESFMADTLYGECQRFLSTLPCAGHSAVGGWLGHRPSANILLLLQPLHALLDPSPPLKGNLPVLRVGIQEGWTSVSVGKTLLKLSIS